MEIAPPDKKRTSAAASVPAHFIAGFCANGIEDGIAFVKALPPDGEIGFVLFINNRQISSDAVIKLLSPHSRLCLVEIKDGMPVDPNRIHLAPAFGQVSIHHGVLHLQQAAPIGFDAAYDLFLQALARSEGPRAVAFLPSGDEHVTGSRMIREAGGRLVTVDFLSGGRAIGSAADALESMPITPAHERSPPQHALPPVDEARRQKLIGTLPTDPAALSHWNRDRLHGEGVEDAAETDPEKGARTHAPQRLLPAEGGAFFRDAVSLFDLQERLRQPDVLERHTAGEDMRIWVLGCGSGEEAYTIAILAAEAIDGTDDGPLPLKVFAVDTDPTLIEEASRGVYQRESILNVPVEYLERYFIEDWEHWRVLPRLRDCIVFAWHNLTAPPLSAMNLIVCRTLLSALPPEDQAVLLESFRYALNPDGFLLLGPDDDVLELEGFEALSTAPHLYRRTEAPVDALDLVRPQNGAVTGALVPAARQADLLGALRTMSDDSAPAGVLIDESGLVVAILGAAERFLPTSSPVSADLSMKVALWLQQHMADAIAEVRRTGRAAVVRIAPDPDNFADGFATLRVQPVSAPPSRLLLISFMASDPASDDKGQEPRGRGHAPQAPAIEMDNAALRREIERLREDAALTRQLASARLEEAHSLEETLKNQLQTVRASETALREELQQVRRTEGELWNIIASSSTAFLLLDNNLNIRFFSPQAQVPFRIIARDAGRPLADIVSLVEDPDLFDEARLVIATREPLSHEVQMPEGGWLMRRIHPYFQGSEVTGVVISYADIRETKADAARAEEARNLAVDLIRSHHQPLVVLDANLHVVFANNSFREFFGGDGDETALRTLVGAAIRATPRLATLLTSRDHREGPIEDCVIQVVLPDLGARTLRVMISRVPPDRTMLAVEDITERVLFTAKLENAKSAAERAIRDKSRLLIAASRDLREPVQRIALLHRTLASDPHEAEFRPKLNRLGSIIGEINGMLDMLQDGAQLDMGTLEASLSTFPVSGVLDGLNADFAEMSLLQGLRWRVVKSGQTIVSDARILRRALKQLIFVLLRSRLMERILIGCRRSGTRVRIEVWLQGVKISMALLKAGFGPRTERLYLEGGETLVQGLDVARRLAELAGHNFRVETSASGQPIFIMDVPAGGRSTGAAPMAGSHDQFRHVLVIDDDTERSDMLRMLLERDGYPTLIATDAGHGIGLALEHPPALIITAYTLPGSMTGLDLVRRIAGAREPVPAAIILTGHVDASVLRDIAASNFEHAPLTIEVEELVEYAQRLLPRPIRPAASTGAAPLGRVFIVDEEDQRRLALVEWLQGRGWAAEGFVNAEAFLHADSPERRGCVVADWTTAETSGHTLLAALRPSAHRLPTVIVADQGDIQLAVKAVSAGAIDFIKRPVHRDALERSIEKASALVAAGAEQQASRTEHSGRLASLTQRQREILDRILAGTPNKIIAADLNLSQRTVENHRATLMTKLGARSLPDLIRIVMGAR